MNEEEALRRLERARVGRLATADGAGTPHVVPFVFALDGRTLYWTVDRKPKRSPRLKRLENIEQNAKVEAVVDHYEEDWSSLWWVRASGTARVVVDEGERARALELLTAKYERYRTEPPAGPVMAIDLARVSGWEGRSEDR